MSGFVVLLIDPFAPTVKYTMPTRKTRERSKRLYTLAEAKDILGRLHGISLEAPFIMACFGSCRSGESLGIRTDGVMPFAMESTTLATVDLVRQTEQAGIEPAADGVLKTRKSIRTVVVLPDAAGRLLEIADERRAAGSEWLADRGDGLPMNRGECAIIDGRSGAQPRASSTFHGRTPATRGEPSARWSCTCPGTSWKCSWATPCRACRGDIIFAPSVSR